MSGQSHFMAAALRGGDGTVVETLDQLLSDVCKGVYTTGGKGTVTLTLEVKPNGGKDGRGGVQLDWKAAAKVPQPEHSKGFAFLDGEYRVTREPPKDEMEKAMGIGDVIDGGKG